MTHILYIYSEISIKGGTDKVLVEKANYLVHHGYQVTIVTEAQMGRPLSFMIDPSVKHIDIGLDFNSQYSKGPLGRARTYFSLIHQYKKRLKSVLEQEKPDIIISIMGRSLDFIASLQTNSIKLVEAHTTKKNLRSLHLMEERGFVYRIIAKYLRRKMCHNVAKLDGIIVLTQQDADSWNEAKRVFVIPNAVPYYPETGGSLINKQVIMVGRYNDAKGYDYLIPAWDIVHKKHLDWTLQVYGSGELYEQVVQWINERHLQDTIILHEPVNNIIEKYKESSICVLSSRYEGFSLVLLEAMACGVPVVSFDCPYGPRNIIRNGEDGLLVEEKNPQALADGICRFIEDESLRQQFGAKARENIRRFSKEAIMQQWMDTFNSLIREKKK